MSYDVQIAQVGGVPLAVVRRVARASELSTVVPASCGVVWQFVRANNLKAGRNVAVYWDASIRLDVGVEMPGTFDEGDGVVRSATPAGTAASVVHFGPYGQLGAAHRAIQDWCTTHNYRTLGPNWEVYGHWEQEWNADPSRIRTDVYYQVAPQRAAIAAHGE